MFRFGVSCAAMGLVLLISCGRAAEPAAGSAGGAQGSSSAESAATAQPKWDPGFGEAPVGYLEHVPARAARGEIIKVEGWAVDKKDGAPVRSVVVYVDDQKAATASLGFPRTDVSDSLARPDMRRAGWIAAIDTKNMAPGSHKIRAVATDSDGNQADMRPIPKPEFEIY